MSGFQTSPQLSRLPPLEKRPGVRLIKDVLRVGRWFVGDDDAGQPQYATFTNADLDAIERRFNEHLAAGISHPLCYGHTPRGIEFSDVDPRDTIADIAHLWHADGVLYMAAYVPKERAAELTSRKLPVSIGLLQDWRDGTGKVWPGRSLLHIAVVSHAVVSPQKQFIELGRGRPSREPSRAEKCEAILWLRYGKRFNLRQYE